MSGFTVKCEGSASHIAEHFTAVEAELDEESEGLRAAAFIDDEGLS